MKHHVILLMDSLSIPGTYITEEWNVASVIENDIPFPVLVAGELIKYSLSEIREFLGSNGFVKREFCPPNNPDSVPPDPEVLKEIGGSASLVELALAGTAVVSMFFFKANGLPKYQKIFELQLPEN